MHFIVVCKMLIQIGARLVRASKELRIIDPEMGRTWFNALEPEFKKEYFRQVRTLTGAVPRFL